MNLNEAFKAARAALEVQMDIGRRYEAEIRTGGAMSAESRDSIVEMLRRARLHIDECVTSIGLDVSTPSTARATGRPVRVSFALLGAIGETNEAHVTLLFMTRKPNPETQERDLKHALSHLMRAREFIDEALLYLNSAPSAARWS